jgi:hypothetical protein
VLTTDPLSAWETVFDRRSLNRFLRVPSRGQLNRLSVGQIDADYLFGSEGESVRVGKNGRMENSSAQGSKAAERRLVLSWVLFPVAVLVGLAAVFGAKGRSRRHHQDA